MRSIAGPLTKIIVFAVVTVLLTTALATTIANTNFGDGSGYTAVFTSASGLQEGDEVRIVGVKVGQVTEVRTEERGGENRAVARFQVERGRELPGLVTATVKYRNLIGQRYLALGTDVPEAPGGASLPLGGQIPVERTAPALDLTALFNGFKPLFKALDPKQVNNLSYEIIQVFQGQGGTIRSLLAHTASLTSTIADKDAVIGQVIDNLNNVLATVNERGPQLGELVGVTQQLVSGLAEQREPIGEAVSALGELTNATAGLLSKAREPLRQDIIHLDRLSENLVESEDLLDRIMHNLPINLQKFTRTVSYGGWFNYFLCNMSIRLGVQDAHIEVPVIPLPGSKRPERCGP